MGLLRLAFFSSWISFLYLCSLPAASASWCAAALLCFLIDSINSALVCFSSAQACFNCAISCRPCTDVKISITASTISLCVQLWRCCLSVSYCSASAQWQPPLAVLKSAPPQTSVTLLSPHNLDKGYGHVTDRTSSAASDNCAAIFNYVLRCFCRACLNCATSYK